MPPEDQDQNALVEALAGTSGRPVTREPYRGRTRVNRSTGERQIWNGTRYVPETASTLAPEAGELIERERNELDRDNLSVRLGRQFLQLNEREATGQPWHGHLPFQDGAPFVLGNPNLQAMQNIQNRFVRSQIREGTSGAGNTGPEQMRIERSGPAVSNTGPANRTAVLNLMIDRDLRSQRLTALEQWARNPQNRGPEGFEQWWATQEPRLRANIQRGYESMNGPVTGQADRFGRQMPNPVGSAAGAIAGQAANGGGEPAQAEEWVRDPQTGRLVRAR